MRYGTESFSTNLLSPPPDLRLRGILLMLVLGYLLSLLDHISAHATGNILLGRTLGRIVHVLNVCALRLISIVIVRVGKAVVLRLREMSKAQGDARINGQASADLIVTSLHVVGIIIIHSV